MPRALGAGSFTGKQNSKKVYNSTRFTIIALYNASFHAARALLFRDGIKERSHYCVCKYIEEKYQMQELVTLQHAVILDSLRSKRNDIQYSLESPTMDEDLNEIFDEVSDFLERVREIIKKGEKPDNSKKV